MSMDSGSSSTKLAQWPIFSLLDSDFLLGVKVSTVFGSAGNEAILVTHDDEVYSLGSNCSSCLGVGDSKSSLHPRRVNHLCKKGVIDFSYGNGPHVLALTSEGELYSWGHNGYGQLGLAGSPTIGNSWGCPQKITGGLSGVRIIKVACGGHHTLALGTDGEVYAWGHNNCGQIGCGSLVNQLSPTTVQGALSGKVCTSIVCGHTFSLALTNSGETYAWGYNGNGQLGIGNTTNQSTPHLVKLQGHFTTQVVCGYAHTMALTDEGKLFVWGSNVHGQLGLGTKANAVEPVQVGTELGRFTEIAAYHNNHISVAMILNGKVYMWGMCRGQSVLSPLETRFFSLDDAFAYFAYPATMWRVIVQEPWFLALVSEPITSSPGFLQLFITFKNVESYGLVRCISRRFDDINTSDLTVTVEGKKLYVHKAILRMRCEYFNSMFQQGRWNEAEKDTIEICQFPYSVYYAFLKYLYTDVIDELAIDDIIGLLDLADSYCESQLRRRCERLLRLRVSYGNVATLMAVAIKYKAEALEDYCFKFALNHMTQVVQSDAFAQLDDSLAKQFIQKAAKHGCFKT